MSHKSGTVIINALIPENGPAAACLTPEQCSTLSEMRLRDEYSVQDRLTLAFIVGLIADDTVD